MSLFFCNCCPLIQVAETELCRTSTIYEPLYVFFSEFLPDNVPSGFSQVPELGNFAHRGIAP